MTDPVAGPGTPRPDPVPGERRLAHPPSDRYRSLEPAAPASSSEMAGTRARGAVFGVLAAAAGGGAITVLGGVLAVSSGLIVAAGATGWVVGLAVRAGTGWSVARSGRVRLAVGLAVLAVLAGQAGLWAYARTEGGVLGPIDYLGETFGILVPLEVLAAWILAWGTAR